MEVACNACHTFTRPGFARSPSLHPRSKYFRQLFIHVEQVDIGVCEDTELTCNGAHPYFTTADDLLLAMHGVDAPLVLPRNLVDSHFAFDKKNNSICLADRTSGKSPYSPLTPHEVL